VAVGAHLALQEVSAVSGLLLSGIGNGSQQFLTFSVNENDFPYVGPKSPANRDHAWFQYGLLSYFSVLVGASDHSQDYIDPTRYVFAPLLPVTPRPPPAMPSNCQATSSPNRLGQQLTLTDASNFVLEQFSVMLRSETPMGAQKPQWIGTAFHGGSYGVPFTLTATGFNSGESWTWSIPGRVDSEKITDNHIA
jgi:hypothetical protein